MVQDVRFDKKTPRKKNSLSQSKRSRRQKQQPHFDWLSGPYNPVRGESAMWIAVITQAMMDALTQSTSSEALYHKHESACWLSGRSPDFVTVCLLAGLDPDYVRTRAKRALAAPRQWRAEAGKGKRYLERKAYRARLKQQPAEPEHNIIVGPWVVACS